MDRWFGVARQRARTLDRTVAEPPVTAVVVASDDLRRRRLSDALRLHSIMVDRAVAAPDGLSAGAEPDVVVIACDESATRRRKTVRALCSELSEARIVVVCPEDAGHGARKVLEAGADGLVLETQVESALALTVLAVNAGQLSIPRSLRHQVDRPSLSARERQILGMLVMGFANAEIGDRLYLAESTVKSHLTSIFVKLGVRSRNEAVTLILDPEERLGPGILAISEAEREPLVYDVSAPPAS